MKYSEALEYKKEALKKPINLYSRIYISLLHLPIPEKAQNI